MASDKDEIKLLSEQTFPTQSNNQITALAQRQFNEELIDSFFNKISDYLKEIKYEENLTLEQKFNSFIQSAPLSGSTDWFDPDTSTGNISSFSDNGIVSNTIYESGTSNRCNIIVDFNVNVSSKKIVVTIFTDNPNPSRNANNSNLVVYKVSSSQIKIGMLITSGTNEKLRLQILAF